MHRSIRLLGTLLAAAGLLILVWVVVVWRWQDPFTAIYTHVEQSRLSRSYDRRVAAARPGLTPEEYARTLRVGDPVGRLRINRIGLNMIVVQGTDHSTLKRGPGHYIPSGVPGEGRLVYVAGHRTTYLAPFSHIDRIRIGDLRDHGRELLRLQACQPRFFATHRYIVDAKLVRSPSS